MRQRLISWLRGTSFVKRLVHLDRLKYDAARSKAIYEFFYFYHPEDSHRVDHWKERHDQFVKQYNEERYWWMRHLKGFNCLH